MELLASNVAWGSGPQIKISFYYEKVRDGANMKYRTQTVISPVTGSSYFGYYINQKISMDGTQKEDAQLKANSPSQWSNSITYTSDWYTVENKTSGTTSVKFVIYTNSGRSNLEVTYSMGVDPSYPTVTQSLNSKSINSIKIDWSSDNIIDALYYSTDNGSTWINVIIPEGTSGSYTIIYLSSNYSTRLSPNTKYNIKTRLRRKDSQLSADSSTLAVTTYDIARLGNIPSVNIGSSHTITYTNPSGENMYLSLVDANDNLLQDYGQITGTSYTLTPPANLLYPLTPNSNTYTPKYKLYTKENNNASYADTKPFTANVVNSNPTFSNFTYADVNSTITALTGSNQIIVKGYSTNRITISTANKAVAKNSATMSTYRATQGTKSETANYSSSAAVNIDLPGVDSNIITVYATDSRGNSTPKQVTISSSNYKQYTELVKGDASVARADNGVGQIVTLTYAGTFWNNSFGSVTNSITSATYKYKKTSGSTWTTGTTSITPTTSGSTFSKTITINGDLAEEGFDINYSYNIQVTVQDRLDTKTYDLLLIAGTPAIAITEDNKVAIGQKYDTTQGGTLQVNGTIKAGTISGNCQNINITGEANGKAWRQLLFSNGSGSSKTARCNNGLCHYSKDGTTSEMGESYLQIGNGTAIGTAGNKRGALRLYDSNTYYGQIRPNSNLTANRTYYMPNKTGTIALKDDIPTIPSKSCMTISQTGRPTITITTAYTDFQQIPLNYNRGSIGSDLEFVTNGIKIKKDMVALISCQLATINSTEAGEFNLNIYKNGSTGNVLAVSFSHTRQGGQAQHHTISPMLVSLSTDDVIGLFINSSAAGTYNILGDTVATYLTIQEL